MIRRAVANAGIATLKGLHLPHGALVGVPECGIYNVANIFTNPGAYYVLMYEN
jgi:hypothetical protein